jgi:hypothetical protein
VTWQALGTVSHQLEVDTLHLLVVILARSGFLNSDNFAPVVHGYWAKDP